MKKLQKCLICVCLSFFALFISVGYAITTATLTVSGETEAIPPNELYITTTQITGSYANGNADNLYHVHPTNVNSTVTLPSASSTVTYLVRVFNNTAETYEFSKAKYAKDKYSNENITFDLTNLSTGTSLLHGDTVRAGHYLSFEVTFHFKEGYTPAGTETLNSLINYEFLPTSSLPPIYIRDVELVGGTASFTEDSIGTNTLNASFTSGTFSVYKITMANRSLSNYGYYATVITNGSENTDISLVDYKLYKDEAKTDALVRRDLLPASDGINHGTLVIYLTADGKSGAANGAMLHTIFDIRFMTPIEEIPAPGVEDGEIAVENALDKFKQILNTDSEMAALVELLNNVPTSGGFWGTALRNNSYVAYVPGAPDTDEEASLELFDGQLEIIIENQKQEVYFLIKREDVTGDGKDDFTVYMTTNPLTDESSINIFSGYKYNKSLATVYAAVFTEDDFGEWVQLGDMFKGEAPICDYDGGMQNYRPSGSSSSIRVPTGKGSFHTDTWVSSEKYYAVDKGS
ncbi:MAG: hypothetical protein IJW38_02465, partial [Clostridia bacterium]|nr:hypothetical protein [Clostridia bacterium]